MHQTQRWLVSAIFLSLLSPSTGFAQSENTSNADFLGGNFSFDARLRYEAATDDVSDDADALTLRSALRWRNGALFGNRAFTGVLELENIVSIGGTDYTDGESNRGTVLIPDPPGTELNQGYLAYRSANGLQTKIGRQRIVYADGRFVGDLAFRQNHQTFDAISFRHDSADNWALNYAYVVNVNRIFGDGADNSPAGQLGDHEQDTHLLNVVYKGWSIGELESYAYLIDNKDFQRASTDTYGIRFGGSVRPNRLTYLYTMEYANQRGHSSNPRDYAASFWRASGGVSYKRFSVQLTQERLGSDNNTGFITPLATLHRFQGWADKFVAQTPDAGLVANFITIAGRWPGFRYRIQYHDFDTDVGSQNVGQEFGLDLQHRIRQTYMIGIKFADYRAQAGAPSNGGFNSDTRRLFLTVSGKFGSR